MPLADLLCSCLSTYNTDEEQGVAKFHQHYTIQKALSRCEKSCVARIHVKKTFVFTSKITGKNSDISTLIMQQKETIKPV